VPLSTPAVIEDYHVDARCQPYARLGAHRLYAATATQQEYKLSIDAQAASRC
jgi:hypothetical protein